MSFHNALRHILHISRTGGKEYEKDNTLCGEEQACDLQLIRLRRRLAIRRHSSARRLVSFVHRKFSREPTTRIAESVGSPHNLVSAGVYLE